MHVLLFNVFVSCCPSTIIRVRDFPLSIGVYHQSFLIAISQPPRLGIEPRLSELLIIIILVLYGHTTLDNKIESLAYHLSR